MDTGDSAEFGRERTALVPDYIYSAALRRVQKWNCGFPVALLSRIIGRTCSDGSEDRTDQRMTLASLRLRRGVAKSALEDRGSALAPNAESQFLLPQLF
jgi:hypothetical protein